MFQNQNEYYKELLDNPAREKPIVEYLPIDGITIEVGYRANVMTYNHPAAYLNDAPYVNTSMVVAYNSVTGDFETVYSKYVLKKFDM